MGLLGGTLAGLAGTAVFFASFWVVSKANHGHRIPWFFGRPVHFPRRVYAYRVVAVLLLLLSFRAWMDAIGTWSLLIFAVAVIPTAILNGHHNRQVALGN